VWYDLEPAAVHQRLQVDAQLALGGVHDPQRPKLGNQRLERRSVRPGGDDVTDRDAAGRLLDGELPEVCQHQRQLLLVVRAARCLPWVLDNDDAELLRRLPGKRTDLVRQLVVGNKQPSAAGGVDLMGRKGSAELGHGQLDSVGVIGPL
jgi:hypothetical protein